jgi:hypothetical protein
VPVELDLDGLVESLRARDHYSLPVSVLPLKRGMDLSQLRLAVQAALNSAFRQAETRFPNDPTTTSEADVAIKFVTFEINDGPMTEDEVANWLTDFAAALDSQAVRITPVKEINRIPHHVIEGWSEEGPITPTAFLFFTAPTVEAPNGGHFRHLQPEVVSEVADDLEAWLRMPGETVTVSRGLTDFICPPGEGALQLRAVFQDLLTLRHFTLKPRRNAFADLREFGAEGVLQYYDETWDAARTLGHLVTGLRFLGSFLDYAYVRMDRPVLPNEQIWSGNLNREPTFGEQRFHGSLYTDQYVIAPHVVQVLNPTHLRKEPDLTGFTCESLGNGRVLAVADDVEPWLNSANPPAGTLARAEAQFEPLLFTRERWEALRE